MKRDEFKLFLDRVSVADSEDFIWWAGYLWLDLTYKQALRVLEVLRDHPCVERVPEGYQTPSGMVLRLL